MSLAVWVAIVLSSYDTSSQLYALAMEICIFSFAGAIILLLTPRAQAPSQKVGLQLNFVIWKVVSLNWGK